MGITEPQAAFSACFGDAFLVLHPARYAEMLADRIRKHNAQVLLHRTLTLQYYVSHLQGKMHVRASKQPSVSYA
jgi:phosphoenolpyruvate carboxykinase (ATP)